MTENRLRHSAEEIYAEELAALAVSDDRPKPPNWKLSPQAVVTYLMGGTTAEGTPITAKYVGNRRLIETAVATLATDRALLLLGPARHGQVLGVGTSGGGHLRLVRSG